MYKIIYVHGDFRKSINGYFNTVEEAVEFAKKQINDYFGFWYDDPSEYPEVVVETKDNVTLIKTGKSKWAYHIYEVKGFVMNGLLMV